MFLKRKTSFNFIIMVFSAIVSSYLFQNCAIKRFEALNEKDSIEVASVDQLQLSKDQIFDSSNYSFPSTSKSINSTTNSNFIYETGQIVGFRYKFSRMIDLITGSEFDHIGIIVVENRIPYLFESMPGVGWRRREFSEARSLDSGNFTIMKFKQPLADFEKIKLVSTLNLLVNKGSGMYHYDYLSESANLLDYGAPSSSQNDNVQKACSEFVRFVFIRAGIPSQNPGVGFVEQVTHMANLSQNELLSNSNLSDYYFIKHLDNYHLPRTKMYWAVSPASIMNDPKLEVAHTTRPFGGKYFSEKEIASFLNINESNLPLPKDKSVNSWPSYFVQYTYPTTESISSEVPINESLTEPICSFAISNSSSVGRVRVSWSCSSNTRQLSGLCKLPNGSSVSVSISDLAGQADVIIGTVCDLEANNFNLSSSISVPYHLIFNYTSNASTVPNITCLIPKNVIANCNGVQKSEGQFVPVENVCEVTSYINSSIIGKKFNCRANGIWEQL